MKFRWLVLKSTSCWAYILSILVVVLAFPSAARALPLFGLDLSACPSSEGCTQTVNFNPTTGTTIVDDTNPPNPFYTVTASNSTLITSGGTVVVTLQGNGSNISNDAGTGKLGFNTLTLTPQAGFAWGAIDFQLDSVIGSQTLEPMNCLPSSACTLAFTVTSESGVTETLNAPFPYEGNNGENQHYTIFATAPVFATSIKQLSLSYTDPTGAFNAIQDMHNIDVNTQVFSEPEPPSFLLLGVGLISTASFIRRRKHKRTPTRL